MKLDGIVCFLIFRHFLSITPLQGGVFGKKKEKKFFYYFFIFSLPWYKIKFDKTREDFEL